MLFTIRRVSLETQYYGSAGETRNGLNRPVTALKPNRAAGSSHFLAEAIAFRGAVNSLYINQNIQTMM